MDRFTEAMRQGISEFNRGYYFEAHDTLEALWMETSGTDRLFLQGLIQVSVGFYHLSNENFKGAVSQLTKGLLKLENYLPEHRGVELKSFTDEVSHWKVLAQLGRDDGGVTFDERKAPRIHLTEK